MGRILLLLVSLSALGLGIYVYMRNAKAQVTEVEVAAPDRVREAERALDKSTRDTMKKAEEGLEP